MSYVHRKNIVYFVRLTYIILGLIVCWGALHAGVSNKSIVATRTSASIRIDGSITEPAWNEAVPVSGFQQYEPVEGDPPTEQTEVRVLFDNEDLYIAFRCFDSSPSGIVHQLTRRDRTAQTDRVSVSIDSYHDHQTAFLFSGSVSGVQSDGLLSNDGLLYDVQWDAVWEFGASITADGWMAEFRIPFSALRFAEEDSEYVWGINFRRFLARKKETSEWVMVPRMATPPGTISSVSQMGHLSGIRSIHPPLHLEILPYTVGKYSSLSQPAPFATTKTWSGNAGLDLKYGLTNSFTLDVAINPDFGQIEVDQAVLNLTVFETIYPEKRPYFLEGAQIFSFGSTVDNRPLRLFYSRRIGKRPVPPPGTPDPGYAFLDNPQVTSILGAAKLTGKTTDGLAIGALSAFTDRETGVPKNLAGASGPSVLLEPRASYNVVRLKQDLSAQSSVGFMGTGTFKDRSSPSLSGGLDWTLRFGDEEFGADGYIAGSRVSPLAGRTLTGTSGRLMVGKLQGEHWLGFSFYDFTTENFDINDIGFFSQPREHGGFTQLTYKEDRGEGFFRRYAINVQPLYRWNWEGKPTERELEIEGVGELTSFWSLTVDYILMARAYDDANRGINGLYYRPTKHEVTATVQSDSRKPFVGSAVASYATTGKGMNSCLASLQLTIRPNPWMEFTPGITAAFTRSEEAWVIPVFTSDGRNLFGNRDVDQYDFSLRGLITFSRNMSVQFFTQLFLAKGKYGDYKKLHPNNQLAAFDFLHSPEYGAYGDPAFNQKVINANIVFRWEYLPASTLYLVWTHERFGDNGFYAGSLGTNISDAFRLPADNVLLAKLTYWWSL